MKNNNSLIGLIVMGIVLASLGGCTKGQRAAPLTSAAVDKALTPPSMETLRVEAGRINHPLLKPVVFDQQEGLTPEQAAIMAVLANPSLRSVRDQRGVAAAQVLQAGLLPNPAIEWGNEFPYAGPDPFTAYSIGVRWEISALISYRAKVEAARATQASVDLDVAWQEWQTAQSAKTAVYSLVSLEGQLQIGRQMDAELKVNMATVRQAVQLQQKTDVDLSAAETAWQEAHTTVLELQRDLLKQKVSLAKLLGLPPSTEVKLRRGLALPSSLKVPAAETLEKGLEDRRLDLLALRRGYDSQQATVRAAILGQFPKTEASAALARDTADSRTAGYGITMDVPIFDRNQGNIAIEEATRQKLFDEFVNRVFEGRIEMATAVVEIRSLNQQIAHAEGSLPAMERLVKDYERALQFGGVDILSYYTARIDVAKKRIEILKLKQELVSAWINLENAAGCQIQASGQASSAPAAVTVIGPGKER